MMCFCRACPCNCIVGDDGVGSICGPCADDRHCDNNGDHAPNTGECPFCHNTIDLDEARRLA